MKILIFSNDVDIVNILVSDMISSNAKNCKYFLGYLDENKIKSLSRNLPKPKTYVKTYEGETNNDICNKVSNSTKEEFDCRSTYNKIYLKIKKISYGDEAVDFYDEEIPKVGSNYTCLAVIWIDFVLEKYENYHPQAFLEESKYTEKEKRMVRYVTHDSDKE